MLENCYAEVKKSCPRDGGTSDCIPPKNSERGWLIFARIGPHDPVQLQTQRNLQLPAPYNSSGLLGSLVI
jgi:hypothetical protein